MRSSLLVRNLRAWHDVIAHPATPTKLMAEQRGFSLRPYEPPSWARDLNVQPTSRVEVSRNRDLPAGDDVDIKSYCVLGTDNT